MKPRKNSNLTAAIAILEAIFYGRFSSDKQEEGDSERRQRQAYENVLARYPDRLRRSTRYPDGFFDRGFSAYHNKHVSEGQLGELLDMARSGKLAGCCLVIDEISRFSRIVPDLATRQISEVVRAGVPIVVNDLNIFIDVPFLESPQYILLQFAIQQAHDKSRIISRHGTEAWEQRRQEITATCPCWIIKTATGYELSEQTGPVGGFVKVDSRKLKAAIMEAINKNMGATKIRRKLNLNETFPSKRKGKPDSSPWSKLPMMFRQMELYGFAQDFDNDGNKAGEPYAKYPALITEDEYYALQAAQDGRTKSGKAKGNRSPASNLFTDLITNQADGQLMIRRPGNRPGSPAVLQSRTYLGKRVRYAPVENAVLDFLDELKPSDVQEVDETITKELNAIAGKLEQVKRQAASFMEQLGQDGTNGGFVAQALARLEKQQEGLTAQFETLKRQQATKQADSLTTCQSVAKMLSKATGDELDGIRCKVKKLVRDLIKNIHLTVKGVDSADMMVTLHSGEKRIIWLQNGKASCGYFHPGNIVAIEPQAA